jgi:hypothetical protein
MFLMKLSIIDVIVFRILKEWAVRNASSYIYYKTLGANVIIQRLFPIIYQTRLSHEEFTGKFTDIYFLTL